MKKMLLFSLLIAPAAALHCSEQKKSDESVERKIKFEELDPNAKQHEPLQQMGIYLLPDLWKEVFTFVGPDIVNVRTLEAVQQIASRSYITEKDYFLYPESITMQDHLLWLTFPRSTVPTENQPKLTWDMSTGRCTHTGKTTRRLAWPKDNCEWKLEHMNLKIVSKNGILAAALAVNNDYNPNISNGVQKISIILSADRTKLLQQILIAGYKNAGYNKSVQKSSSCIIL